MAALASREDRPSPEQRIVRRAAGLAFAMTALATAVALLSRLHWFAELFSHFRLYYLMIQALLLVHFLHGRAWLLVVATVLLAVPNARYVAPYVAPMLIHPGEAAVPDAPARIVSMNLAYSNRDYGRARDYIAARDPDLLALAEYTPAWARELARVTAVYPYRHERAEEGAFGLAVFSRLPLAGVEWLDISDEGGANLRAAVSISGRTVRLYALHLYPPTSPVLARARNRQLEILGRELAAESMPRLVVGDLNLTPFSPYFTDFLRRTGLKDRRRPGGLHITWPTTGAPLWIPIDHCLADAGTPVTGVRRGPDFGSDHYPLEITVGFAPGQQ